MVQQQLSLGIFLKNTKTKIIISYAASSYKLIELAINDHVRLVTRKVQPPLDDLAGRKLLIYVTKKYQPFYIFVSSR